MILVVLTISTVIVAIPMPWFIALLASVVAGNCYGSMMFLAHEIGHGAITRSRRLQRLCMYPGCAIFMLSPYLWVVWHNQSHHGHTNRPDKDPDNFGTLECFQANSQWSHALVKFAPGSKFWRSAVYLFIFFTLQSQYVLWKNSRTLPGYENLNRRRAIVDSAVMAVFWGGISMIVGRHAAIFVVIIPMLVANFVLLSYVVTNHMVRPLSEGTDTLVTTMSVKTLRVLDRVHFHFSHHVEHHLFPSMPSSTTPLVRKVLTAHFPGYLAPPHWLALLTVLRTPRVYDGPFALVDPYHGSRVELSQVENQLRNHS
jgi:fatty acid desaturase